jgi:hypothetical protein
MAGKAQNDKKEERKMTFTQRKRKLGQDKDNESNKRGKTQPPECLATTASKTSPSSSRQSILINFNGPLPEVPLTSYVNPEARKLFKEIEVIFDPF